MKKIIKPTEITAKIYNDLVKVFNDGANDPQLKVVRDQIIQMRKDFPTYSELKESGIKFVSGPSFVDKNGEVQVVKTWMGSFTNPENDTVGDVLECDVLYTIDFVRGARLPSGELIIGLKVRGIPKGEFA